MRILQISDFHFTKLTSNPFRLFPKRIFGHLNWLINRKNEFSFSQIDELPELFFKLKIDLILFGGDFSSSAMPEEFVIAKELVEKISIPWIAIPGNHDKYTYRSYQKKRFYDFFSNSNSKFASLKREGVEAHNILQGWWVVALDTAKPTRVSSSEGFFSNALEAQLQHLLFQIPQSENIILLNHYPFFPQEDPKRELIRGKNLECLIRHHPNICLYLHGHTHRHSIADLRGDGLPIVVDSGSCSLKKGGSMNLIELKERSCEITPYYFNKTWEQKNTREFVWEMN